jgi:hypothetical protein
MEKDLESRRSYLVSAAQFGHLDCLRYLHEVMGIGAWTSKVCSYAAEQGNLACLKYAHERRCPWDKKTCTYAAQNGHLDCLMYAFERGCHLEPNIKRIHTNCIDFVNATHRPYKWVEYKLKMEAISRQQKNDDIGEI